MFLWPNLQGALSCSDFFVNHLLKSVLRRGLTDVAGSDKETRGEASC